jgi:excisionase family DNA binding protein
MVRASKVAAGLGVTQQTVKKAIKRGDIPGVVIGSLYLVNAAWYASVTSWPPASEVA